MKSLFYNKGDTQRNSAVILKTIFITNPFFMLMSPFQFDLPRAPQNLVPTLGTNIFYMIINNIYVANTIYSYHSCKKIRLFTVIIFYCFKHFTLEIIIYFLGAFKLVIYESIIIKHVR